MAVSIQTNTQMFVAEALPKPLNFGRQEIRSNVDEVTSENIRDVLGEALPIYQQNKADSLYLWWYYRGFQPVLNRRKLVRENIKNDVVENRANEIVCFKVGYQFGEPVQYVGRSTEESVTVGIKKLNDAMFFESKPTLDRDLCEWWEITGTSYRMVLPDPKGSEDGVPFELYTLDPTLTFVIYKNDYTKRPLLGATVTYDRDGMPVYNCYTDKKQFIVSQRGVMETPHTLGQIPIIEYKANNARLGSFEIVLPILDAINTVASNRVDAIEQFVQAIMVLKNVDIDSEQYEAMLSRGAIKLKSQDGVLAPDIEYITAELNQTETQTLVDYMYETVLTICGMPSRNGQGSTSDTGAAVLLRDGWSLAEARAKDVEWSFKKAETEMLRLILHIYDFTGGVDLGLKLSDIDMKFTRRNYEAVQSKAQVLDMLLKNNWVDPLEAYAVSGLFSDPEGAYIAGARFHETQMEQAQQEAVDNEERGHENLTSVDS